MNALRGLPWTIQRIVRHHGAWMGAGAGLALIIAATSFAALAQRPAPPADVVAGAPPPPVTDGGGPSGPEAPPSGGVELDALGDVIAFGCDAALTIHYDPTGEPFAAGDDLRVVAGEIADAMGRFIAWGDVGPGTNVGAVNVRWVPSHDDLGVGGDHGTLGIGGTTTIVVDSSEHVVRGEVVLNAAMGLRPGDGPDGVDQVLRHELIHAVGGTHRDEGTAGTVMTPTVGSGGSDGGLGPLDLEALDALGGDCGHASTLPPSADEDLSLTHTRSSP